MFPLRRFLYPFVILLIGLAASGLLTWELSRAEAARARARFDGLAAAAVDEIEDKLGTQITLLRGATAMFTASENVSRDEFASYVHRLRLEGNYPGVLGVGLSAEVRSPAELTEVTRRGRAYHGDGFRVWPGGGRDVRSSILLLEPLNRRNQTAIGFDMMSEATRRAAMLRARDARTSALSGKVELVQEIDAAKQPGFLIYTPLYEANAFRGWVYSPLRAIDLFGPLFANSGDEPVAVAIHDGEPVEANLLYRSAPPARSPAFAQTRALTVAGRTWSVAVSSTPAFDRGSPLSLPAIAGIAGVLTTLLVAALAFQQSRSAGRIERQVRERTAELRRANRRLIDEAAAREAAEAQVRHMQKVESLGQLTGGIAHDFNNMLAVVIGSLDLAKRRAGDPARVSRLIDQVSAGASRAAELTQRLLAFSRQQSLAPRRVDPNRLVGSMSELLARTLGEAVTFEVSLAADARPLRADPVQLESAILNLAVNARDAMPDGGVLTISTANEGPDQVVIAVSDTGTGMSREVLEHVFEPFFTTKEVGRGTGLGLSQVFGFARQSGGDVRIETAEGRGTTVRLFLPRDEGGEEAVAETGPAAFAPGRPEEIVLVVEDEEQVRLMTVETLRDLGYTVLHAPGGREALALMESNPGVRLLFTDIVMPGMDGPALGEAVRERWPETRLLYATGYAPETLLDRIGAGRDAAVLRKPFTREELAARVREALDGEPLVSAGNGACP